MRGKKWKKKDPGHYANPESDFVCEENRMYCFSAVSRWGLTYIFIVTSIEIIVQVEVDK